MNAREGDLIETKDNIVFDVKGLVHPPDRVVAFIRYVPDPMGSRERDGRRYSKFYNLSKRYALLKQKYPQYLVDDPVFNTLLCEVPIEDIKTHYQPAQGLQKLRNRNNLDTAETAALRFMEIIKEHSGCFRVNPSPTSGASLRHRPCCLWNRNRLQDNRNHEETVRE